MQGDQASTCKAWAALGEKPKGDLQRTETSRLTLHGMVGTSKHVQVGILFGKLESASESLLRPKILRKYLTSPQNPQALANKHLYTFGAR